MLQINKITFKDGMYRWTQQDGISPCECSSINKPDIKKINKLYSKNHEVTKFNNQLKVVTPLKKQTTTAILKIMTKDWITAKEIRKKVHVNNTMIYEILNYLKEKGLIKMKQHGKPGGGILRLYCKGD